MSLFQQALNVSGTNIPTNGAADKTVISAKTGKTIYVQKVFIGVTAAAAGGGGLVGLEDGVGGTRFVNLDADAVGGYSIDFGEPGYPLTSGTLLNATVDGAATTQATATVTVTGIAV